jgi:hypothetical protein
MSKFEKQDGWRTKGTKQLTSRAIEIACNLTDRLEKQGIKNSIVMHVNNDCELERARNAWAGFVMFNGSLRYKGVEVRKG